MGLKEHKKKALIVTGLLLTVLLIWTLIAVHDSAVAAAKAARASKASNPPASCPFSTKAEEPKNSTNAEEPKKKCCHSSKNSETEEVKKMSENSKNFEKYANLKDEELEEFLKQFTDEQLAKCPHLKAKKTNNKKK